MMNENIDRIIKKQGIISGLLLGIIVSIISIFSFYYVTKMVTSVVLIVTGYLILFPYVLPVCFSILFIARLRVKIGGYWSFKQAVRGIFIIFLTAYLTQFLLKDVVFNRLIEPDIVNKTETALVNDAVMDFKRRKISQKDIDQKVKNIHEELDTKKHATVGQQIQKMGIDLIFLFVLALIFAAFFKRELQYYDPNAGNNLRV